MLRKTICACVLVLAGLLLMGCSRQNESKKPQAEQTNESNILDHFVIEKQRTGRRAHLHVPGRSEKASQKGRVF